MTEPHLPMTNPLDPLWLTRGDMFASEDAETSIGLAIGAASMCWDPPPTGVFDSTAAAELVDLLVAHLRQLRLLP